VPDADLGYLQRVVDPHPEDDMNDARNGILLYLPRPAFKFLSINYSPCPSLQPILILPYSIIFLHSKTVLLLVIFKIVELHFCELRVHAFSPPLARARTNLTTNFTCNLV
jgi:hypothetical protein